MQIFCIEDTLHEMSNYVSKKKKEKNFKMPSAEKFTRHAIFLFFNGVSLHTIKQSMAFHLTYPNHQEQIGSPLIHAA